MNTTATRQIINPATLTAYGAARLVKVDHAYMVDLERQTAFVDVSDWLPSEPIDEGGIRLVAFDVAAEYDALLCDTVTTIGDEVDGLPVLWIVAEADFDHVCRRMADHYREALNVPNEHEWERRAIRRTERAVVAVTR